MTIFYSLFTYPLVARNYYKRTKDMTKYYLKNDKILESLVLDSDNTSSFIEYFLTDIATRETVENFKLFDSIQDLLIALSRGVVC